MADINKFTNLTALKALAQENKTRLGALGSRVSALENTDYVEGIKVNGSLLTLTDRIADILVAEGTVNGTVKVNSVDIPVHGLAALAYKAKIAESDLADALKTAIASKAAQSSIDILNGTGDGSISKMIDDAFNDFATKVTDDNVVNSYKELIDYVAAHGAETATMTGNISTNTAAIADLKNLVGTLPEGAFATTVVGYIAEAIAAIGMGDYAKTAEVTAMLSNYCTKTELTAELSNYYTKSEISGMIATDEEVAAMLAEVYGE